MVRDDPLRRLTKKDSDQDYSPVMTINTKKINFTGEIVITPGFIIQIKLSKFELALDKYTNSHIGYIDPSVFNKISSWIIPILESFVNYIFEEGIDCNFILEMIDLHWIGLDDSEL